MALQKLAQSEGDPVLALDEMVPKVEPVKLKVPVLALTEGSVAEGLLGLG